MMFAKRLRDGVREGRITTSIRIWQSPRVTVGRRYAMEGFHFVPPQGARVRSRGGKERR